MKTRVDLLSKLCVLTVLLGAAMTSGQQIPTERGHWSSPLPMNRDASNLFYSVIDRVVVDQEGNGVKYTPTSYSLQLVNGKRYRFYCRANVLNAPVQGSAMITVFVHMGGHTELVAIQDTTKAEKDTGNNTGNNITTESGKTYASVTGRKPKWLPEPLYPRIGPYLQAPRKTTRRL